jgi:predicted GIY-YIG superfamily endonuclease
MRTYYLYQLVDPNLNIPKYIGITNNIKERFHKHLIDSSVTRKTKWIKSLIIDGKIPSIEIIKSTTNVKEVIKWEIEYIAKYKDIYSLTNTTSGGEYYGYGTPIKVYDLNGTYLESYSSMIEYTELMNLKATCVSSISNVCLRKRNYAYGHIFRYIDDDVSFNDLEKLKDSFHKRDPKHFYILNINGKIIGEFNSLQQAEKEGFGNYECISQCLRNIDGFNSVKGNIPCFNIKEFEERKKKYINGLSQKRNKDIIAKYSIDGDFLEAFYTFSDAARNVNAKSITSIKNCCNLKYKQAYGYQWRYGIIKENIGSIKKVIHKQGIPVNQYDLNGNLIKCWKNCSEAAKNLNMKRNNINIAAKNNKSSGGYIWKYAKPCN